MKTSNMTHVIIGLGEIGSSLFEIFDAHSPVYGVDISTVKKGKYLNRIIDNIGDNVLHICIRHCDTFNDIVHAYVNQFRPNYVVVHSTVPIGTTESLKIRTAVHSPNQGLHPNLAKSIRVFTKHIGGVCAPFVAKYFEEIGIKTRCHATSETTEAQHICCNTRYGVDIMFSKEIANLCRKYNLDYHEVVTEYTMTHNEGYRKLGHGSTKTHAILQPLQGKIGGHCIVQNALLIPELDRGPMMDMLAHYNDDKGDNK